MYARLFVCTCLALWPLGLSVSAPLPPGIVKKCERPKCDCGCKEGGECDCKLIEATEEVEPDLQHLPPLKLCAENHAIACRYRGELERRLEFLGGWREKIWPAGWWFGPLNDAFSPWQAGGFLAQQVQTEIEEVKRRELIWNTAWYAANPGGPDRKEAGEKLRILIGDYAFITGRLPGPLPGFDY